MEIRHHETNDTQMTGKTEKFDPDKRVDTNKSTAETTKDSFEPDKRIENNHKEIGKPIQNKIDGLNREKEVYSELKEKYPESKGYQIVPEAFLRDKDGKIVKDSQTGEARRIDFVVIQDGKVCDAVEVTSLTAPKEAQMAKENRIREGGGNFIKDSNGNLCEFSSDVTTRIERRQ